MNITHTPVEMVAKLKHTPQLLFLPVLLLMSVAGWLVEAPMYQSLA